MNRIQTIFGLSGFSAGLLLAAGCVSGPGPAALVDPYRPELRRDVVAPVARSSAQKRPEVAIVPVQVSASTNVNGDAVFEKAERVLRKGDRIQVTIYAPPEPFSCPHVVDEDGRINIPMIGPMAVAGKTCGVAQRLIEKTYIDQQIYKTVTVIIVPPEGEYTISGEVIRPMTFPLGRDLTLLQAVSKAGRLTEYADSHRVFLLRNNERVEINMDDMRAGKRKDIVIISGDVIEVPRSKW
jgi:polysaccharide export outer membrane protein